MIVKYFLVYLLLFSFSTLLAEEKSPHLQKRYYDFLYPPTSKLEKREYQLLKTLENKKSSISKLEYIATIAPKSILLEQLTYRTAQELQYEHYALMQSDKKENKINQRAYQLKKNRFLKIIRNINNPSFSLLYTKLYFEILNYNPLKNIEILYLYKMAKKEEKVYTHILTYLHSIQQMGSSSRKEQKIIKKQLWLLLPRLSEKQKDDLLRYTALQLSNLYEQNSIEALLSKLYSKKEMQGDKIFKTLTYVKAEQFETYLAKVKHSFIEKIIFKAMKNGLKRNDLTKILITLSMKDNHFEKVQYYIRKAPRENTFSYFNPFNGTLNINNKTYSKATSSQRIFAETMFRLQYSIQKNPQSARDHFLYATGLFNKSWFGNFPMSSVLYRPNELYKGERVPPTADLSNAEYEYRLALAYTKDLNFKAQISYQLLKIEFHRVLSNTHRYEKSMIKMPKLDGENHNVNDVMKLLKSSKDFIEAIHDFKAEFSHSNYGKKVIKNGILLNLLPKESEPLL